MSGTLHEDTNIPSSYKQIKFHHPNVDVHCDRKRELHNHTIEIWSEILRRATTINGYGFGGGGGVLSSLLQSLW
jgi:hypothetical protein